MLNNYFLSINFPDLSLSAISAKDPPLTKAKSLIFLAAAFLVCVPVFIQAPLVRQLPYLSLALTVIWVTLGWWLHQRSQSRVWGDLLLGFSWSWLAGSIYWGWFRTEPYLHLPIEAIGLPFCLWWIWSARSNSPQITPSPETQPRRQWDVLAIGNWFYFGSLLGTALTDGYFYVNNLIPYWRRVMDGSPSLASPVLHQALAQINNGLGWGSGLLLLCLLVISGIQSLKIDSLPWYAFSGAVLSTILVDGLFWLAAFLA